MLMLLSVSIAWSYSVRNYHHTRRARFVSLPSSLSMSSPDAATSITPALPEALDLTGYTLSLHFDGFNVKNMTAII